MAVDSPMGYYVGKARIDKHLLKKGMGPKSSLHEYEITGLHEWFMINPFLAKPQLRPHKAVKYEGTIFIPEHAIEDAERIGTTRDVHFKRPRPF